MHFTTSEQASLKEMLGMCQERFGDFSLNRVVYASGCDSCTGSCKGHGMSVWTACDVK